MTSTPTAASVVGGRRPDPKTGTHRAVRAPASITRGRHGTRRVVDVVDERDDDADGPGVQCPTDGCDGVLSDTHESDSTTRRVHRRQAGNETAVADQAVLHVDHDVVEPEPRDAFGRNGRVEDAPVADQAVSRPETPTEIGVHRDAVRSLAHGSAMIRGHRTAESRSDGMAGFDDVGGERSPCHQLDIGRDVLDLRRAEQDRVHAGMTGHPAKREFDE